MAYSEKQKNNPGILPYGQNAGDFKIVFWEWGRRFHQVARRLRP